MLFKRIDVNGDGIVDKDELTEFLLGTFDGRALPRPGVSGNRPVRGSCAVVVRDFGSSPLNAVLIRECCHPQRGNQVASEVKRMMAEADPTGELGKKAISFPAFKNVVSVGHPSCLHSTCHRRYECFAPCQSPFVLSRWICCLVACCQACFARSVCCFW